jgi:hypothetical protein
MTRVKETDLKLVHEVQDKKEAVLAEYKNKEKVKVLTVAERLLRIERFLRIVE